MSFRTVILGLSCGVGWLLILQQTAEAQVWPHAYQGFGQWPNCAVPRATPNYWYGQQPGLAPAAPSQRYPSPQQPYLWQDPVPPLPGPSVIPGATPYPNPDTFPDAATLDPEPAFFGAQQAPPSSMTLAKNMIGDFGGGGSQKLFLYGFDSDGDVISDFATELPSTILSRLNVAEMGSPVLRNRVFTSYRHFHNSTRTDIIPDLDLGRTLNVDQFLIGIEKIVVPNMSVEFRAPLQRRLGPTVSSLGAFGENVRAERDWNFGNIATVMKFRLLETDSLYVTGGLGINIPTGRSDAVTTGDGSGLSQFKLKNESVGLQPFLAWTRAVSEDIYTLGFLQFDLPVNESTVTFDNAWESSTSKFRDSSLFRLNYALGAWLLKGTGRNGMPYLVGMQTEFHYTTTLSSAKTLKGPEVVGSPFFAGDPVFELSRGSVDMINGAIGCPVFVGNYQIYNGFTAPFRGQPNRAFDFEYLFAIQRNF